MQKEDRNTAIVIIIVLVVCAISLIAIGGSIVSIVAPVFNGIFSFIGFNVKLANANYNFALPAATSPIIVSPESPPNEPQPVYANNNFAVPSAQPTTSSPPKYDGILLDAQLADSGNVVPQTLATVIIPKIGLQSEAIRSGDPLSGLEQGMWVWPESRSPRGALTLLCLKDYFSPTDPRNCANVAELAIQDEIWLHISQEFNYRYEVVGIGTFDATSETVYQSSADDRYLKIVIDNSTGDRELRTVVLASLVE